MQLKIRDEVALEARGQIGQGRLAEPVEIGGNVVAFGASEVLLRESVAFDDVLEIDFWPLAGAFGGIGAGRDDFLDRRESQLGSSAINESEGPIASFFGGELLGNLLGAAEGGLA